MKIYLKLSVALVFVLLIFGCSNNTADKKNNTVSVYERVITSGTIKASYLTYPPACMKDTKTGKMSGIFVDVLQKACDNLGLKLEWTEEVGWASQIEGLENDRYDIVGSPVWANPTRGKLTTMAVPVYYSGIGVFVRANDNRFDGNFYLIDNPSVRIGTIDGETADLIARSDYSKAQRVSSPQNTEISQKFLDLASNKCDVVFTEPYYAFEYLKNNPGTIKNIAEVSPIRLFGNCYMFKKNEFQLKQMLDVAIQDLINSGFVDRTISKYEPAPHLFYRSANQFKPF
jgi:polar amino acid transport system substrate-binding protein